jgi:hypothetical protein
VAHGGRLGRYIESEVLEHDAIGRASHRVGSHKREVVVQKLHVMIVPGESKIVLLRVEHSVVDYRDERGRVGHDRA